MKAIIITLGIVVYGILLYLLFFKTNPISIGQVSNRSRMAERLNDPDRYHSSPDTGVHKERLSNEKVTANSNEIVKNDTTEKPHLRKLSGFIKPTSITIGSYKAFTMSNTLKTEDVKSQLSKYMTEEYSERYATTITKNLTGKYIKRLSFATMATGGILIVEQYAFPFLSFYQRLFIAISIAGVLLFFFYMLQGKGILK